MYAIKKSGSIVLILEKFSKRYFKVQYLSGAIGLIDINDIVEITD